MNYIQAYHWIAAGSGDRLYNLAMSQKADPKKGKGVDIVFFFILFS